MGLIWQRVKKFKKLLFLALLLAAINQFFSLLDPQVYRLLIDNYATKVGALAWPVFFQGVLVLLLAFMGVAFVSRIAKNFQEYYVNSMTQRVGASMYESSVQHTFSLPYAVFEDRRSGELLQKLQKARTDTQTAIENFIGLVFLAAIGVIFVIIYAFWVHWSVGLAYLVMIPILGGFTFMLSRKIKAAQMQIVKESAELAGSTTETIRNVELVKSLGLEDQEIKRLNSVNNRILNLELKKIKMIRRLSFWQGTAVNAMRALLLFLLFYLLWHQVMTLGELFSLLFYSFFIFTPLGNLGTVASQYQEAKASLETLEEVLKIPPEEKPKDAKVIGKLEAVSFKDVTFTYSSANNPALTNNNFTIKAGETIAFAGASGSGKTTIAKLFVGLYKPSKGVVSYNGIDNRKVDLEMLRSRVGLVAQETQLFAGTIRENLLFASPKATDAECLVAIKSAAAMNILERGGKGLDTRIGEGGIKISGGERQRLAIARALLRNPDLIIFDEATSSLDSISEKSITDTIKTIKKTRPNLIVVLIAHRLSTIIHADRIYVLEKGKVIESGDHKKLLKKKGLYWAFWREQTGE